MNLSQVDFRSANQYIPHIILAGIGIGTSNYILHGDFNWIQWVIQSVSTSFIVGFSLLWIVANKLILKQYLKQNWKLYLVLMIVFFLIGIIATEVESMIKNLIFRNTSYVPFSSDKALLSNSIISAVLGFSFFLNDRIFSKQLAAANKGQEESLHQNNEPEVEMITKIPVKQGENIQLINVQDIAYFEAFDNYSNLYHLSGKKMLCDYSLIFLEKRLNKDFSRIHRKYIVNTTHIKQITPHLNGRFLIQFNNPNLAKVTSSKGYLQTIRKLVKLD